ncbi:hypothetical protein MIND_00838500 [Mycena indigotica]|uniref:Uncharacterized protein n=1 Tax=Mycena indigotica TaxID=2126181 RepID=A0A8H6SHJ0_9AGAR|nr:uncharacterized protein MIND_00838500 [Mycena indigotica]KAF7298905.1 hypothetical protein MIND_00838500 [Mycena indigotica]
MSLSTLPTELVALIATYLYVGESITFHLPAGQHKSNIVAFSQVSALLRAVAFSLRHPWTNYTLILSANKSTRAQYAWAERRFAIWKALARGQPIRLQIIQEETHYGVGHLVRFLGKHSHSLSSLVLDIPDETFVSIAKHTSFPFPSLTTLLMTLHLKKNGEQTLLPQDRRSRFFAKMPQLQILQLGYSHDDWHPLATLSPQFYEWDLPLSHLTVFCMPLIWLELPEFLLVLRSAPNLHTCTALVDAPPVYGHVDDAPFILDNLKALALTFRMTHPTVWTYFSAPALQVLDITLITGLNDDDHEETHAIAPADVDKFYSEQPHATGTIVTVYRVVEYAYDEETNA